MFTVIHRHVLELKLDPKLSAQVDRFLDLLDTPKPDTSALKTATSAANAAEDQLGQVGKT